MASGRYTYRRKAINDMKMYQEQLDGRNVRFIEQYATPTMLYPNDIQMKGVATLRHTWRAGDRYYKLSHKHYGKVKFWWVIAWFNRAPTESHLSPGQIILIPSPLEVVLSHMRTF
jgi:nucleoid-associated protein YgaU